MVPSPVYDLRVSILQRAKSSIRRFICWTISSGRTWLEILILVISCTLISPPFSPIVGAASGKQDQEQAVERAIQPQAFGGTWRPLGPAPKNNGQSENASPNNQIVGAVHSLAAHPTNANILYVGGVNGGIWKTTNASAASPTWVQQTDPQLSLSIGALEFDPTDSNRQTLVAGIGRFSSFGRRGGPRTGLLRTADGGSTWTPINGGGALVGKNISGVAPRGSIIVVSVNAADVAGVEQLGIFRSVDGGASFTQVSSGNGAATGLPGGITHDLASDPITATRLFTGVVSADTVGGVNGIYRSTTTGASWSKVSNSAMDSLIITGTTSNIELAIGRNNNVFVAIVNSGRLAGVFRSGDGGTTWTAMDVPNLHPGSQGGTHLSIVADPTTSSIVYLGGDRANGEFGARNSSGRLFRCNSASALGSQCVHLTHSSTVGPAGGGTLSNSSPHADSREMVFDAAGNIIEGDDGGIFRRTSPRNNQGDWFSIGNNLQLGETHSIAFDSVSNIVMGGMQDNGTGREGSPDGILWENVSGGDGGDVAIDDISTAGMSIRYSSSQNLGGFRRQVFNASNVLQSSVSPALQLVGGGVAPQFSFTTPIRVNTVNGRRLIIGGANGVYESLDQGDTIRQLTPLVPVNSSGGHPIAYGASGNPDVLYIGSGDSVWIRNAAPPAALVNASTYPGTGTGRSVIDLVVNPSDPSTAFVIDSSTVYVTRNGGASWTDVTGNLTSFNPVSLRSVAFVSNTSGDAVAVGTNNGVFAALATSNFTVWDRIGSGFPNVPVFDLEYKKTNDLLVAGTLGRGAWALSNPSFSNIIFSSTFDAGADGFTYVDDAFGTNQPAYAVGTFVNPGGFSGGGLRVVVGGVDSNTILNMSGGWRRTFTLGTAQLVSLAFNFNMTQTSEYESDEFSEALVQIDAQPAVAQARVTGNGNGGAAISTGALSRVLDLGCLPAGTHTVTIGVRNNKKTLNNESTELLLDDVMVRANGGCQTP